MSNAAETMLAMQRPRRSAASAKLLLNWKNCEASLSRYRRRKSLHAIQWLMFGGVWKLFKNWKDRGKRLFFNTTEKLRRLSMLHFDRFHFETHMRIASFRRLTKKEKQLDHWVSIGRDFRNVSKWEGRAYFLSYILFGRLFYLFIFFWFLRHQWAVPFANAIWSARCWIAELMSVVSLSRYCGVLFICDLPRKNKMAS